MIQNSKIEGSKKLWIFTALILVGVLSRWIPHPPNMTALMSVALFSGAVFRKSFLSYLVPLLSLLVSDLALGFHDQMAVVYITLIVAVSFSKWLFSNSNGFAKNWSKLPLGVLSTSGIFFVVSNLSVWMTSGMYPKNLSGLVECYVMAIPFFHNQLIGNIVGSVVLFGIGHLLAKTESVHLNQYS